MIIVSERQRQIMDALFLAVESVGDLKKVTMDMVAERAGMRRQSIYEKHFRNIGEIIETIHALVSQECEERMEHFFSHSYKYYQGNFISFFEQEILPLLYEKRDWLRNLYSSMLDSSWTDYAQKVYTPYIKRYLAKVGNHSGLPDDFVCGLIVRQIIAIVATWLTSDKPDPVSLFRPKFDRLLKTSTYDLLFDKNR